VTKRFVMLSAVVFHVIFVVSLPCTAVQK